MKDNDFLAEILIEWYLENKRDLPWRKVNDPYIIWLSEIILQQTRVVQGTPYYYKFVENYPTVSDLANASEDEVLKDWEGLGYYSRARNMRKAAQKVISDFNGDFPSSYSDLITLPGIGEYTASAISSFSKNENKAVLDGNVFRFLSRYFGIETPINTPAGKKEFQKTVDQVLDQKNPGLFNQAIMEFGALQCKPKGVDCTVCPFQASCFAFLNDRVNELPNKLKGKKSRDRYFHYLIIRDDDNNILMNRRDNEDIWAGLYEFPLIETQSESTFDDSLQIAPKLVNVIQDYFKTDSAPILVSKTYKHLLSHQNIYVQFYILENVTKETTQFLNLYYVGSKEFLNLAKPKVINLFLGDYRI